MHRLFYPKKNVCIGCIVAYIQISIAHKKKFHCSFYSFYHSKICVGPVTLALENNTQSLSRTNIQLADFCVLCTCRFKYLSELVRRSDGKIVKRRVTRRAKEEKEIENAFALHHISRRRKIQGLDIKDIRGTS